MKLLSSLTNRIFLASALLAVLATGISVAVVNVRVTREAEAELQRGLDEAGRLVEDQRARLVESFTLFARLVADLPVLKGAVDTRDPATVQPIAADYQQKVGADLLLVSDRLGRRLAEAGPLRTPPGLEQPAVADTLGGRESVRFWPHEGGILQVVTVPISLGRTAPEIMGTLSVGFLFNEARARRFKELTDSDVAFASGGRVRASTLPAASRGAIEALTSRSNPATMSFGGQDFAALVRPLSPAESDGTSPVVVVLRSRTERLRFLRAIHTALAATGLVALLLATLLSYLVARTVTRPLATITGAMREMAATGQLSRTIPLPSHRWDDEDARLLAATFNSLTESVTRYQREASQRERLSALGRLSTVIAHEIRNPLMIIKTSLRALRRDAASPAEICEAASDIDGEVGRLNRVVNDVLDFARPMRFDLAASDLNAVCRASVAAVRAAGEGPEIAEDLSPDLPEVVTDPDRLRTAVVNILANARYAVAARRAAPAAATPEHQAAAPAAPAIGLEPADEHRADVSIETRRAGEQRVIIVVRDCGVGIDAEQLPRVFEPFFTTRRAGTGLGLPIVRNIVEGLGGMITVKSTAGVGTEVRIELPVESRVAPF